MKKENELNMIMVWSRAYTEINIRAAKYARSEELGGRGQNLNNKFKTFDFLDTLKVHIRSNYLASIRSIYTSNKTIRKKQYINFFNSIHSLVSDLKSV